MKDKLKLLTMNIGNPSIDRARLQAKWLEERDEDIFVLTETKNSSGCNFIEDYFMQYGFDLLTMGSDKRYSVFFPKSTTGDLGVMIISRIPIKNTYTIFEPSSIYYSRLAACDFVFNDKDIRLIGLYVPSRDQSEEKILRKKNFCVEVTKHIQTIKTLPAIICGDLNILDRNHKPHYSTFLEWEYNFYDFFIKEDFEDCFKCCYPDVQEYSWVGRTGDGYRYDYFFMSNDLKSQITDCSYLHETRKNKLTDHSSVILEIK